MSVVRSLFELTKLVGQMRRRETERYADLLSRLHVWKFRQICIVAGDTESEVPHLS